MFSAILIDDEEDAIEVLKSLISRYCPSVKIIAESGNFDEAKELISDSNPDIIFLDINLGEKTGFDLLLELPLLKSHIVFVSAYGSYAGHAFRYDAIDFLVKPVNPDHLVESISRVKKQTDLSTSATVQEPQEEYPKSFTITQSNTANVINPKDIVQIQGEGAYSQLILSSGERILTSKGLKHYDFLLDNKYFLKVHQSYIVNITFMKKFINGSNASLVLNDDNVIPISRRRKEEVINYIDKLRI